MDSNLPIFKRTRRGKTLICRDLYLRKGKKHAKTDNGVESASCSSFAFSKSKNQKLSETKSAVEMEDFCSRKYGGRAVDSMGSYSDLNSSRKRKISTDLMEDGSENCVLVGTSDGEYFDSVQSNSPCCRDVLGERSPPEMVVHNDIDDNHCASEDSDVAEPLTDAINDDDYQRTESSISSSYSSMRASSYSNISVRSSQISVEQGEVNTVKCRETVGTEGKISGGCDDSNCVAKRTRSHFGSFRRGGNGILGTFRHPFCIDGDWDEAVVPNSSDSTTGGKDASSSDGYSSDRVCSMARSSDHVFRRRQYRACMEKRDFHTTGGKDSSIDDGGHGKTVVLMEDSSIFKIFLLNGLDIRKDSPSEIDVNPSFTVPLPSKFSFGRYYHSNILKRTEIFEELWTEFDFALKFDDIGSIGHSMADSENQCSMGEHHFVLDEQIGIVCEHCSFVKQEIKHVLPSFSAHHWGKGHGYYYGQKECNSMFEELQHQDPGEGTGRANDSLSNATTGTVWDIIPGSFAGLYQHQREGFEFLWRNVAGGINLDKLKESVPSPDCGSGCIISHAPGTGKTKLTIVFIQSYMHLFPSCRPVIIAPKSMLLTWEEEFKKWNVDITFHNMNKPELSGEECMAAINALQQLNPQDRGLSSLRLAKLHSWKTNKSILGISYRLFEQLAGRSRRKPESDVVKRILLELPGLLILDEGHTPRNDQSLIWKALSKIETEKRIILSGTPFQNNFRELYNTLCLVRPKFADKFLSDHYSCQNHKFGRRNLARGKWTSLTSSIGKPTDDDMLNHIRDIIDPFVHVHKGGILQERLPGLTDSVVVLRPSHLQITFIEKYTGLLKNALELGYFVSLISVHPSLLPCCLPEAVEKTIDRTELEKHKLNPNSGVKTKFLMELIRLSETLNEKVLVFSQYIDPLSLIIEQLKSHFGWTEGKEILYMDGQLNVKQRQSSINVFNEQTSESRILLASTRACSEGINLVGASRVVLLDVVWNPSVERQAISRAYRLGQTRVVYIYHLITAGTMEGEKYCRQAGKDRLSELVFSSVYGNDHTCKMSSSSVPEDKVLEALVQHETLKYMFEKIIYQPKESDLIESFGLVD